MWVKSCLLIKPNEHDRADLSHDLFVFVIFCWEQNNRNYSSQLFFLLYWSIFSTLAKMKVHTVCVCVFLGVVMEQHCHHVTDYFPVTA